jgi:hypothetical protein
MAAGVTGDRWNAGDMRELASGTDPAGRPLPQSAWMAVRRLGWTASAPAGVTVNDRVIRMAQEQAGRTLRSAVWRDGLTRAVTATWPADPALRTAEEWDQVRAAVPGGEHLAATVIKARTRQVARYLTAHGRLPVDLFELEPPPPAAPMMVLAACDRQQASIGRDPADTRRAVLRVQLPSRPDPAGYKDWSWVAIPLRLPPTVPATAMLHLPTVHVTEGGIRADVSFTQAVPRASRDGHEVALGIDWGVNTLLSAGPARIDGNGVITALGAGAQFRAAGILAKSGRLRRQGEALKAKSDCYERLIGGRPGHPLAGKAAVIAAEFERVSRRRANLNDALAWSAARWAADQAIAAGATVIYVEDLRTMEAKGMGRTTNTRMSQTVRSQVTGRLRHIAAEHGIAVVTIPARGTSRHCPRCLAVLRHRKAPDKPATPGWKWALCPGCGWQGDRDQGAWQRIAARGLAHQAKTVPGRKSAEMTVRAIDEALEARAVIGPYTSGKERSKTGPAPRRNTARRAPRRRTAPSPPNPSGNGGQRPEGRATPARLALPRAASRDQGATTISPARPPHKARGAALGAGFHLGAHAPPPRETAFSNHTS